MCRFLDGYLQATAVASMAVHCVPGVTATVCVRDGMRPSASGNASLFRSGRGGL